MKTVNLVKRVLLFMAVAMATVSGAWSQEKGEKSAAAHLVSGSGDSYSNIGLNAAFRYGVTDPIRLEGSFTYFLKKDHISMWDVSVSGHYLFKVADKFTIYPLAGLGIFGVSWSYDYGFGVSNSSSESKLGVNLGGGAEYQITPQLALNAEAKYKIVDNWNRSLLYVGIAYKF
jgi:outer membrane protein X